MSQKTSSLDNSQNELLHVVNWVRFSLTGTYGIIVFIFFFAYLTGILSTSNLTTDLLYIGGLIMVGIILTMASLTSETKN
jgi:hypothetical protein